MSAVQINRRPAPGAGLKRMAAGGCRALAAAGALLVAACGGGGGVDGGESAPDTPVPQAAPTIGAAGGAVSEATGARVVVPAGAVDTPVTLRIAKDGTGAPPLPAVAAAAGAVYTITPHGGAFAAHAEVTIPVDHGPLAENEQLLLLTASPGETSWRVLSGASYSNGAMRALVAHFSFFQVVVVRDVQVPRLYVSVANYNNEGSDGMAAMSPNFEFGASPLRFVAKLRYARPPINVNILPTPRPTNCAPTSYGKDGAKWYFERNGSQPITPVIEHRNLRAPVIESTAYPRTEAEFNPSRDTEYGSNAAKPGFGAVHFYAQNNPRRGSYIADAALPPANNVMDDDVLTWRGDATMEPAAHNGRHRVDVWVPTVCGFSIEAVPLLYKVNLPGTGNFGFRGLNSSNDEEAGEGSRATLYFEMLGGNALDPATLRWEFSIDRLNWQARPLPAGVRAVYPLGSDYLQGQLVFDAARADQTGFYRAYACNYSIDGSTPTCVGGLAGALSVVTAAPSFTQQPQSSVAMVGETASFTAVPAGAPAPALQWQTRPAGGTGDWTNVTSGSGAASASYTTAPLTLAANGMQFRVVASNSAGTAESLPVTLSVSERNEPPAITSQPASLSMATGGDAALAVVARGTGALSYQWQLNGTAITGANAPLLRLTNVGTAQAGNYTVTVSNAAGTTTSNPATLTLTSGTAVAVAPSIVNQPVSVLVNAGNTATFAVGVAGTGPFSYQWLKNGQALAGATAVFYSLPAAAVADAATYQVRVSNAVGSTDSFRVTLTVNAAVLPTPVAITTQPAPQVQPAGGSATFAVAATGSGPLRYQWLKDGQPIAGQTGPVLAIQALNGSDAARYSVTVDNGFSVVTSDPAVLTLLGAPAITAQPQGATQPEGGKASFSVTATGQGLRYLWLRNGVPVPGATSAQFTTPALTLADSGAAYSVVVFNNAGVAVSSLAVLSIEPGLPANPSVVIAGAISSAGLVNAPSGPGSAARLDAPSWLARDAAGNLYVSEGRNLDIRKITPQGAVTTLADGRSGLVNPKGLAVGSDGLVYVADGDEIKAITPAGVVTTLSGLRDSVQLRPATFKQPRGLAISGFYLFVADFGNYAIKRIDLTNGTVYTVIEGSAGQGLPVDGCSDATLTRPIGIAVNDVGFIWWSEENDTIRFKGECVFTVAGSPGVAGIPGSGSGYADGNGRDARFFSPQQLSLDRQNKLYVADFQNSVLRRIELRGVSEPGTVTTVFGVVQDATTVAGPNGRIAYPLGVLSVDEQTLVATSYTSHVVLRVTLP